MNRSDRLSELTPAATEGSKQELEDQLSLLIDLIGAESKLSTPSSEKTVPRRDSDPEDPREEKQGAEIVVNWTEVEAADASPSPSETVPAAKAIAPASDSAPSDPSESDIFDELRSLIVGSESSAIEDKVQELEEHLRQIEHRISDPRELIEMLLPIVAELLDRKVQIAREEVCQALFPITDRIIYQRAQQDREAVSSVLATIIPAAIAKELQDAPHEIVTAIAPAMGAAIREQVRLDRNSIAQVLAPEMGRAIKQQVELEKDAMIDALYPVVGSIVKRYLTEAIQEINRKVSNTLSPEGFKRKIHARARGVSEAELILSESIPVKVKAVFLIHKASGLAICQAHQSDFLALDAEMIGGMLTAIRSFVKDCIAQSGSESELNEIEYGDSKILLEVAGYCYLAVVVQGEPPLAFIEKVRNALGYMIQKYGDAIELFDGDPDLLPEALPSVVENLMEIEPPPSRRKRFPWALLAAVAGVALAIATPLQLQRHQQALNRRLERSALTALYEAPELSVYRFSATADREKLLLQGRVPSEALRDRAEALVRPFLAHQHLENRILAVDVPPDPQRVQAEVQRVETLLNRELGIAVTARYETLSTSPDLPTRGKVVVSGLVNSVASIEKLVRAFERIPGVNSVNTTFGLPTFNIPTRIYFKKGSVEIEPIDREVKIESVVRAIAQYPEIKLKIVGYSPASEGEDPSKLAFGRAAAVRTALLERGIASARLEVRGLVGSPSDVSANSPDWWSQCVLFEVISPTLAPDAAN